MKEIVLNEKSETVIYIISTVLQGYCETIYHINETEPETAMNIVLGEILSEILYDVLIAHEVEVCVKDERYKDLSDINVDELKEKILYWHKEHIIELVLKNINQNDTDGPFYWKLKMRVDRD
ncbi:hypothetical protein [Pectobacterium carotovorum]|uniref:hypothetical protein n=1 Tax=Pectobacterium carotovorum TaxID=554 RepID=UPI0005833DB4|nr:hypothetical protein [Pectobacterium carotovorum]KHS78727.1 hypothetical protein RC84_19695 [Pectobacterium carotovorum subsp. carotovorum]